MTEITFNYIASFVEGIEDSRWDVDTIIFPQLSWIGKDGDAVIDFIIELVHEIERLQTENIGHCDSIGELVSLLSDAWGASVSPDIWLEGAHD